MQCNVKLIIIYTKPYLENFAKYKKNSIRMTTKCPVLS